MQGTDTAITCLRAVVQPAKTVVNESDTGTVEDGSVGERSLVHGHLGPPSSLLVVTSLPNFITIRSCMVSRTRDDSF